MDGRFYEFTHDERGLRQTMEIGGRTTQYRYDERGNLSGVIMPTGSSWSLRRDDYEQDDAEPFLPNPSQSVSGEDSHGEKKKNAGTRWNA